MSDTTNPAILSGPTLIGILIDISVNRTLIIWRCMATMGLFAWAYINLRAELHFRLGNTNDGEIIPIQLDW